MLRFTSEEIMTIMKQAELDLQNNVITLSDYVELLRNF